MVLHEWMRFRATAAVVVLNGDDVDFSLISTQDVRRARREDRLARRECWQATGSFDHRETARPSGGASGL